MKFGFVAAFSAMIALGATACVDPEDKGEEEELPTDGKLDSFAHPVDNGKITFGPGVETTLSPTARYLTWTFSLTAAAKVHAFTGPSITGRQITDTVIYLYKQQPNLNWGAYIARNDDFGGLFSSVTKNLDAGNYRILVKGYTATTYGRFSVHAECDGAGCAPLPPPATTCLFGSTFGNIVEPEGLPPVAITGDRHLHVADYANASALEQRRIVLAVQQSAHTDVTTYQEAFAAVDQGDIRRVDLYDEAGARAFVAFEYGSGDNSYGAIFAYNSTQIVSQIHDGDLYECTAAAQTCALGGDWYTTRNSGAFTVTGTRVVTTAGQLTGVDATNALAAIRVAYTDATSVADGLTRVDERKLNVVDLRQTATGTMIRAYEYGAGDNSYGAIYRAGTSQLVSTIVDLTYYDCALAN
jgi:hypothetical protein